MVERPTFSTTVVGSSESTGTGVFDFETSVLLRRSRRLHLWVYDHHFVSDAEGCVQTGQYLLVTTPSSGIVALVTNAAASDAPTPRTRVKVEYRYSWDAAGVSTERTVDYWSKESIESRSVVSLDDDATVEYIRPTKK
ncbi:hypothetical protein [Haloferax larsenii]|uniref:Uncharacterized protein n=1 Tax=Haloferax larsenii TaxID=302484 RepID=A0A1H7PNY7_HALLR|nr:hypothetical protein [Haloferax larsenii]SEL37540.1 hypothetical protein SAMN04488691_104153 [Haloferax larsenii]